MPTFTWAPQTAKKKQEPNVSVARYGDGYEQRIGTTINALSADWALTFVAPVATIDAIDAFLEARAAVESFDWTDPRGNALTVVCDSWDVTPNPGLATASLSATFRQVHE